MRIHPKIEVTESAYIEGKIFNSLRLKTWNEDIDEECLTVFKDRALTPEYRLSNYPMVKEVDTVSTVVIDEWGGMKARLFRAKFPEKDDKQKIAKYLGEYIINSDLDLDEVVSSAVAYKLLDGKAFETTPIIVGVSKWDSFEED